MPTDAELDRRRQFLAERLAKIDQEHPGFAASFRAFTERLMSLGGDLVVPPPQADPLMDLLHSDGAAVPRDVVLVVVPGAASACHANAAELWRSGEAAAVGTGYALSDDGMWREHSWAWSPTGELIETTAARVRYFGLRFEGERARWFADWVSPIA